MVFDIRGKVALITGGCSGLGLRYAKELLKNGLRGAVLADVNETFGKNAVEEITKEFGANKAVFVKCDVTDIKQFEEAFKKAIDTYGNIDILINNAGILNDAVWEKEIAININAVVHGNLLGIEKYIPKYKSGTEGVIVNISSIAGLQGFGALPVYTATKFAVHGLSLSWGKHYERTKVKVLAFCPGVTDTPLISESSGRNFGDAYEKLFPLELVDAPMQPPEDCAKAMVEVIKNAPSATVWVAEGSQPPYQFELPKRRIVKQP